MDLENRTALTVLGASIALGALGALLFDGVLGLNAPLLALAAATTHVVLRRRLGQTLERMDAVLLASVVAWSSVLAWRDSPGVMATAIAALGLTLFLGYLRSARGDITRMPVSLPLASIEPALKGLSAAPRALVVNDVDWVAVRGRGGDGHASAALRATARGLVLSVPVVLVFGTLLISADARFESMTLSLFEIDAWSLARSTCAFVACAWTAAGTLRIGVLGAPAEARVMREQPFRMEGIEVLTVLAVLDLLFASYVAVQFTYFFGGDALVREVGALTYAEYARRGFFELVILATLVVPLLLCADWFAAGSGRKTLRAIRWLAGSMIVMVAVIELSAAHRMLLYTEAFGLTTARLYTTMFMLWLLVALGWFAATVLLGQRERFMPGSLVAALLVAATLVACNPDATIARTNLERGARGHRVDVQYLLTLSTDATPTLLEARGDLGAKARRKLDAALEQQASALRGQGWREFNLARARAAGLIEQHRALRTGTPAGALQ
jgi:hypothetical protein